MAEPVSIVASFLSNVGTGVLIDKICDWLKGLSDEDSKRLDKLFKTIRNDLSPTLQRQCKKLADAPTNVLKAAIYPIALYKSNEEKLQLIKSRLIATLTNHLSESDKFVADFISVTRVRMEQKSDPLILGEISNMREDVIQTLVDQLNNLKTEIIDKLDKLQPSLRIEEKKPICNSAIFHITLERVNKTCRVTVNDSDREVASETVDDPFQNDHFKFCLNRFRKLKPTGIIKEAIPETKLSDMLDEFNFLSKTLFAVLFQGDLSTLLHDQLKRLWQRKIDNLAFYLYSPQSDLMSLPYETIFDSWQQEQGYLFQQEDVFLARTLQSAALFFEHQVPVQPGAPPLRILMAVSSPHDLEQQQKMLEYEREMDWIINAMDPLRRVKLAEVDFTVGGSIEEIERHLSIGKHHVLHLSGHGFFDGAMGYFLLEDQNGASAPISARDLTKRLKKISRCS